MWASDTDNAASHVVLGLLSEPDGLGAQAIVAQSVALESVRRVVSARLPPATDTVPELNQYDQGARKALELTFREALRMGHNYIGTEHILLALMELEDENGVLIGLGLDKSALEANIAGALAAVDAARPTA